MLLLLPLYIVPIILAIVLYIQKTKIEREEYVVSIFSIVLTIGIMIPLLNILVCIYHTDMYENIEYNEHISSQLNDIEGRHAQIISLKKQNIEKERKRNKDIELYKKWEKLGIKHNDLDGLIKHLNKIKTGGNR